MVGRDAVICSSTTSLLISTRNGTALVSNAVQSALDAEGFLALWHSPTASRRAFLEWLERQVAELDVRDPGLRHLLSSELWPYRQPGQQRVASALRNAGRSALPVTAKRAARRIASRMEAVRLREAANQRRPDSEQVLTSGSHSPLRILIISPDFPTPLDQGFRIRVHHLASALAEHRHEVSLLAPSTDGSTSMKDSSNFEVLPVTERAGPHPTSVRWRMTKLLRGHPSDWLAHWVPSLRIALDRLLTQRTFDIIQVEIPELLPVAVRRGAYVVLDSHNIWSELGRRRRSLRPWSVRRASRSMLFWRDLAVERRAWRKADLCLATSTREQAVMRAAGARAVTVPNGVELAPLLAPVHGAGAGEPYLVFVGVMSYEPNADAMLHMIRDIMPLVRRERPDVKLVVVGRGVSDELAAVANASIQFAGGVPDVRPYVAGAAVSVVPLRAGSGTRLKILEAMALGCPVVSTSVGAEGLDLVNGIHALISDGPDAFAASILSLLAAPERAKELARAGRTLAESKYAWSVIGKTLTGHYEDLASGRDVAP
jgi:glycosyltransferase involved in cell wall biosynthesis